MFRIRLEAGDLESYSEYERMEVKSTKVEGIFTGIVSGIYRLRRDQSLLSEFDA